MLAIINKLALIDFNWLWKILGVRIEEAFIIPKRKHPKLTHSESKVKRVRRLEESVAGQRARREMEKEHALSVPPSRLY